MADVHGQETRCLHCGQTVWEQSPLVGRGGFRRFLRCRTVQLSKRGLALKKSLHAELKADKPVWFLLRGADTYRFNLVSYEFKPKYWATAAYQRIRPARILMLFGPEEAS